jgi:small subunit ribosomal protein S17e
MISRNKSLAGNGFKKFPGLRICMGRVRPTYVKRLAKDLVDTDPERFSSDFDENKEELKETGEFNSKKLRNRVAGYIVRVKENMR